ncbi:hypothetical protein [Kutzneria sp. NPDC052558]
MSDKTLRVVSVETAAASAPRGDVIHIVTVGRDEKPRSNVHHGQITKGED